MLKIGHRGAAGTTPENTEASFREALKRKVDMVEFDVRLTKDGKLVVFHDSDLSRICNEDVAVSMLTLKELKKYDVGSWYNSNYVDEKIVTLQEVITSYPITKGLAEVLGYISLLQGNEKFLLNKEEVEYLKFDFESEKYLRVPQIIFCK